MNLRPRMIFAASALAAISFLLADSASADKAGHVGNHHGAIAGSSARNMGPDRYPGYARPGYALGAGAAVVGGAIAASQPGYGYADYGYGYGPGPGTYGYDPGYPPGPGPYGYDPGYSPGYYGYGYESAYPQSGTYVGGPKTGTWSCFR